MFWELLLGIDPRAGQLMVRPTLLGSAPVHVHVFDFVIMIQRLIETSNDTGVLKRSDYGQVKYDRPYS